MFFDLFYAVSDYFKVCSKVVVVRIVSGCLYRFRLRQFLVLCSSARGCLRLFLLVLGCQFGFSSFQVDSVVVGCCRLQFFTCLGPFFVVVGCCSLFQLFCRFQVVPSCFVSAGWFKLFRQFCFSAKNVLGSFMGFPML